MSRSVPVVVHFKDIEDDEQVREVIQRRCEQLAGEFEEIGRVELTLFEDGAKLAAHAHVTGKNTDVATSAGAEAARAASDQVLDKVERQLRKMHDKRIFAQRREAQRDPPKRREAP